LKQICNLESEICNFVFPYVPPLRASESRARRDYRTWRVFAFLSLG
jgi:hypothetical protein